MAWIKTEDELPIQNFRVRVKNGKQVVDAKYYRKKWYTHPFFDAWYEDHPKKRRKLHKVTEWEKCPISYPKISRKEMKGFLDRVEKYRHQIQSRKFTFMAVPPLS